MVSYQTHNWLRGLSMNSQGSSPSSSLKHGLPECRARQLSAVPSEIEEGSNAMSFLSSRKSIELRELGVLVTCKRSCGRHLEQERERRAEGWNGEFGFVLWRLAWDEEGNFYIDFACTIVMSTGCRVLRRFLRSKHQQMCDYGHGKHTLFLLAISR